jgi:hypothetical protein
MEQFEKVEKESANLKPMIERKVEQYRGALDQQYARIFDPPAAGGLR